MIRGLRVKLIGAMVLVTLTSAAVVAVGTQRFTEVQFERFLDIEHRAGPPRIDVQRLLDHHARTGGWAGVEPLIAAPLEDERFLLFDDRRQVAASNAPDLATRAVLGPEGELTVLVRPGGESGQAREEIELSGGIVLEASGRVLGTLYILPPAPSGEGGSAQDGFLQRVARIHYLGIAAATLLALLLAAFLARRIVGPVERLTTATRKLTAGDLAQRVPLGGGDEIGELARSFNAMAATIERNEELRRRMVGDVAHELRTPVTHLRCRIETVQDGLEPLDDRLLNALQSEIVHLARLVDDLQELALAEAGQLPLHPAVLEPEPILRGVAGSIAAAPGSNGVRVEIRGPLPRVHVDPDRLRQVLRNLLENARRHSPAGGVVTVAAWTDDGRVVCEVRDEGDGIAPEHLDRVFERFYRTDPARGRETGGAGLGLPIVRQLVSAWGGSVTVDSAPGKGTRMRFDVPAATRRAGTQVIPPGPREPRSARATRGGQGRGETRRG